MLQIDNISSDPQQKHNLLLPDGTNISMTLSFKPMQLGWFITELIYQDFTLQGMRICNSPNMLYQFKNIIPFGLACFSTDDREPTQVQDFSSGSSKMYILSEEEMAEYSDYLSE